MCGRFSLRASASEIAEFFGLMRDLVEWDTPRLGLIPSWAKDTKLAATMINARAETVAEKPAFRAAFKRRRCLVPASGFYEWRRDGKTKVPYLITLRSEELFAFAGLWERWKSLDGELVESCTVLTTSPNELMATIHDRMPVILKPADYGVWLDPDLEDAGALSTLLASYPTDEMQAEQVSDIVNIARNEVDPRLPR